VQGESAKKPGTNYGVNSSPISVAVGPKAQEVVGAQNT